MSMQGPGPSLTLVDGQPLPADHGSEPSTDAGQGATSDVRQQFDAARQAYRSDPFPDLATRLDRLDRLEGMVASHGVRLAEALCEDYGNRSMAQTLAAEAVTASGQIRHTRKRTKTWMEPRKQFAGAGFHSIGGSATLQPRPLGVIGIISPWNFPVALTIAPLASALAAGNVALCKASEFTPATAEALRVAMTEWFHHDEAAMVTGGVEVATEFTALPFNHLFFTGSTAVGRRVMAAAAENLTPVTLELGGKSPLVLAPEGDLDAMAKTLISGKIFNAGQYCVAPDRVFVPAAKVDRFLAACRRHTSQMSKSIGETSIINAHHYQRLTHLLTDAEERGAQRVELADRPAADHSPQTRTMPPVALLDVDASMEISEEEIFGPLFTVHPYTDFEDVILELQAGPAPLAAYYFGPKDDHLEHFVTQTPAGGVVVNDIMLHVGLENLPFGGVGQSGMGVYHGQAGFDTFSHLKPVVTVRSPITPRTTSPPSPAMVERFLRRKLAKRAQALRELMPSRPIS